jgi:hypothetical protein
MILFQQDWLRFPGAIIDYHTKNASWLRQAEVYNKMGVQNSAFLLALLQPELQGIDPQSAHLDTETKVKIGLECRFNPWYVFREVIRVPPQGGSKPRQLEANRGNIALWWAFFNSIDSGLVQPRQTGKSLSTDSLMIDLTFISAVNSRINMITKDDSLRKANVDRLKGLRNYLPKYLVNIRSDDSDNVFELTCKALGNVYQTGVAQNSESNAANLGRGLTSPVQHFDEGPFISFIDVTIPAALAAGTAAKEEAAAEGRPNANVFTTTAGKKDSRSGAYMYDLFHEAAPWSEEFFDAKDRVELIDMINKNKTGRKLMVNITMSHRQLGKTDEWLYAAIANTGATGEAADRDFFNVWTSGSLRSPLTVQLNEAIRRSQMDEVYREISPEKYMIRWFHTKEELELMMNSVPFIIGLDTSDAVGRDAIAMTITNAFDLSVVGVGSFNETNLIRFAEFVAYVLIKYTNATLVIERRSSGMAIIDALTLILVKAGIDPFRRMYNKIVDDHIEKPEPYKEILRVVETRNQAFYDTRKKNFGVPTDAYYRNLFYGTVLQNAAKRSCHNVKDLILINEINSLVEKDGRIDHKTSGHDDHVIAWLLTHWFMFHARNLVHYGIDPMLVGAGAPEEGKEVTEEEMQARFYQEDLFAEVQSITEEMNKIKDPFVVAKLESRLKAISNRLMIMNIDAPSFDALIKISEDERDKKFKMNGGSPYKELERPIDMNQIWRRNMYGGNR